MDIEPVGAMSDDADLASLFAQAAGGDDQARDALFATLYAELHRLAQAQLRRSHGPVALSPTTLLHEAYLQLSKQKQVSFPDRNRFFGYAARAMRGLILNSMRDKQAQKRGGALTFTTLNDAEIAGGATQDVERLQDALEQLVALDPRLAELVDLRFFCGLSFAEIASLRGTSERTLQRDWAKARALLYTFLGGTDVNA